MVSRFFAALALLCAPAQAANGNQAMLGALQAMDARVAAIGHRLAVAGLASCEADARPLAGFLVHTIDQYQPALRADAAALFGLGDAPGVLAIAPGSAAARGGLRVGDSIASVDGQPVAAAPPPKRARYDRTAAVEALIEQGAADGALDLAVERGGQRRALSVAGDRGCPARFQVDPSKRLNASADGNYVQVSSALVDFTRGDDELALVIAHELSHNILKHRDRLDAQHVSRGLFRAFGKNPGRIRATENEADRLALRLMHKAGFDIVVAPAFWDRFGRETSAGIFSDRTHAGRRERVALAEAEIAAIRGGD